MKMKATQSDETPTLRIAKVKDYMEKRGVRNYISVFAAFGYTVKHPTAIHQLLNGRRKPTTKDLPAIRAMEAVVASMQALPALDIKAA